MKLVETIERCEKLIRDEIDCYDWDIRWYENNLIALSEETKKNLQRWNEEKNELIEMLNNLKFIKYETKLQELDEMIEKENETLI
jgi:hypothetical protein